MAPLWLLAAVCVLQVLLMISTAAVVRPDVFLDMRPDTATPRDYALHSRASASSRSS